MRYIIISPVRDEEKYVENTLGSVISQTIRPVEWVIVDDGSTDATGEIIERYAREYPWLRAVHRSNRGHRKSGGGVVEAFYDGYQAISAADWDYVVKLDGDLTFENTFFEECFEHFRNNRRLGIAGGTILNWIDGRWKEEKCPKFHVRGATKVYRKDCWNAIGGLIRAPGWDTIDEVKANMLGWETCTLSNLRVLHHRFTGDADGTWKTFVKNGLANYISGYHPLFMILKCLGRIFRRPIVVGGIGLLYGFLGGYMKGVPQVDDAELIQYLRNQQINRLLVRPSIWK